jgi:cell division protease FtsH
VAEELIFGEVSTGAQNDLQRAADIARRMVKEYGMSERLGAVAFEPERRPLFLPTGDGLSGGKPYSEDTARQIDQEVKLIVDETHARVREILTQRGSQMKAVAQRLLEQEVLEGEELRQLLKKQEADEKIEAKL